MKELRASDPQPLGKPYNDGAIWQNFVFLSGYAFTLLMEFVL